MKTIEIQGRRTIADTLVDEEVHYVVEKGGTLGLFFDPTVVPSERRQRIIELRGRGARAEIVGAWHGHGTESLALHLDIDHAAPETWSRTDMRAVLSDEARLIFTGMLHIRPGAIKSDTFLRQDSLLLSPRARADATPSLEIEADDVKAGHAATAKPIDREQLFYLLTRGIPRIAATDLLIDAFIGAVRARKVGIG